MVVGHHVAAHSTYLHGQGVIDIDIHHVGVNGDVASKILIHFCSDGDNSLRAVRTIDERDPGLWVPGV